MVWIVKNLYTGGLARMDNLLYHIHYEIFICVLGGVKGSDIRPQT